MLAQWKNIVFALVGSVASKALRFEAVFAKTSGVRESARTRMVLCLEATFGKTSDARKSARTPCKCDGFTFRGYIGAIFAKTSDVCRSARAPCKFDGFTGRGYIGEDTRCTRECAYAV